MTYFKVNDIDLSKYVSQLKVRKKTSYVSNTNARGNTYIDYINEKYEITVGIIPLEQADMEALLGSIDWHSKVQFKNPEDGELKEIDTVFDGTSVDYYTIQPTRVLYNKLTLVFKEL